MKIRKSFDQYVNLRPVKLLRGAPCPLKDAAREDIHMTFIRENSEGEYAGSGSWLFKGKPNEVVIQDGVFSRTGCERIIRYAFETARKEKRSPTSISKANALNYSMVFWDQIFRELSAEYPDVETHSYLGGCSQYVYGKGSVQIPGGGHQQFVWRHPRQTWGQPSPGDGTGSGSQLNPGTEVSVYV